MQIGEVPVEGPEITALNENLVLAPEHDGAKAVPLGLEQEIAVPGDFFGDLREHRFDRLFHF